MNNTPDFRASVPGWLRRHIVKRHPAWVMEAIDFAGLWHDVGLAHSPHLWREHNARMIQSMRRDRVPGYLVRMIAAGLWVYWRVPRWVRNFYWK